MENKFDIDLKPIIVDDKVKSSRIRGFLNESNNIEVTKAFLFLYKFAPLSASALAKLMTKYYCKEYSSSQLKYYLNKLLDFGLIGYSKAEDSMMRIKKNNIDREIIKDFNHFLERIPDHLRKRFRKMNYYYVSKYGEEFIVWAAKVIGVKVK